MYLYSFFKTGSVKYGFGLKCCYDKLVWITRPYATTHEFDGIASWLLRITSNPQIFKITQRNLIDIVLSMERESAVVHESDRPEFVY